MTRNQSLDILRGIAILLVIVYHYAYLFPLSPIMNCGWIGVDLFFVLSGFLISGLLFAELGKRGKIDVLRFYIRRGFKIYPSYYAFLVVIALGWHRFTWSQIFFLQNYFPAADEIAWSQMSHTWSLAVEEHFYLCLPLLLLALYRFRLLRLVPMISIALFAGCAAMRAYLPHGTDLFPSHLRMDSLFAGVALGYFWNFRKEEFLSASRWWLLGFAAIFVSPAVIFSGQAPPAFVLSMNTIGFSLLLLWAFPRRLKLAPLAFIGRYSYSIYVWHIIARDAFPTRPNWPGLIAFSLASILAGVLAATLIEIPALKVREKFFPSEKRTRMVQEGSLVATA